MRKKNTDKNAVPDQMKYRSKWSSSLGRVR